MIMEPMLLAAVLAAAPALLPAPVPTAIERCRAAACSSDENVRVCKCIPETDDPPGIIVDRPDLEDRSLNRHVEWDARAFLGEVGDFQVLRVDLDDDGVTELVVANRASESNGLAVRTWEISIVDGRDDTATHAIVHDWGADAIGQKGTLLLTEWEWSPATKGPNGGQGAEPGLVFVGREYRWKGGRLEATKDPVLRRRLTKELEQERGALFNASADRTLAPRRLLANAATQRGGDELPARTTSATVIGLTREDPLLLVHLERPDGELETLSGEADAKPVLRIGDAKSKRLFPPGYSPPDAEEWLVGRSVKLALDGDKVSGAVWVQ